MTLSQKTQNSDELARIIGRDNCGRQAHVEISMRELNDKYGDTFAEWTKTQFSQRERDAFYLYLYSKDLQYIYKKYAECVTCIGNIEVVWFKG